MHGGLTCRESIAVHGSCDPRFARIKQLFHHSFDSGEERGAMRTLQRPGDFPQRHSGGPICRARLAGPKLGLNIRAVTRNRHAGLLRTGGWISYPLSALFSPTPSTPTLIGADSGMTPRAIRPTTTPPIMYHAGASGLPVRRVSQATRNCVDPPPMRWTWRASRHSPAPRTRHRAQRRSFRARAARSTEKQRPPGTATE